MFTSRRFSILGLALCATAAGATAPALTRHAAAASAAPKVSVVGHVSTRWVRPPNPMGHEVHQFGHKVRQMTLRITGSNFVPESKVSIAVVNTFHWKVAAKGTTYAQRASTGVLCGHDFKVCLQPNPRAGTIAYRLRLSSAPSASDLAVLYRSAGGAGVQSVTLR